MIFETVESDNLVRGDSLNFEDLTHCSREPTLGEVGSSFHEQDEGVLFDDLQSVTIWSNEEVVRTDERRGEKGRDEVSGEEQGEIDGESGNSSGRKEGAYVVNLFACLV